jgi:site-specific DNA-methyltransferase (adenine-specific)
MHGDCLDLMKEIPDGSVDMVLTSPPYDNLRSYNGNNESWGEQVWKNVLSDLYRVTKGGGVVVWIAGDATVKGSETGTSFKQALWAMGCGFNLSDTMIYHKSDSAFPRHGHQKYPGAFEYMFVLVKGKPATFNLIRDRKNKCAGRVMKGTVRRPDGTTGRSWADGKQVAEFGARSNVWGYSTGYGKSSSYLDAFKHPAIFPEKLAIDHIISWSNEGDVVLDPFMGSGTTGAACKHLGRDFIGIELDDQYFDVASKRISEASANA